ncbi:Mannose-6-phosphate isomerase [Gracilaria domingensis]|nr:Mannose-6-phosphate isomerase [Gracilaria domingensis]
MDNNKVRMALNPLRSEVVPLHGAVTSYKWGKQGRTSLAAFLNAHNKLTPTDPDKPYSEFILSSQVPHQTTIASTPSLSLLDFIQSQVIEVDPTAVRFYQRLHNQGVPYILKIVSVAYPQPLRVHPDAETSETLAEELGFENPNERPAMLVALSQVDLLFGFQSAANIVSELLRVPEFTEAVGRSQAEDFVRRVKSKVASPNLIKRLIMGMLGRAVEIIDCLAQATARLRKMPKDAVTENDVCFMSLQELYPVDPMCFAVYFLNRVKMSEGNAIFIHENEPYCVLNGDFIEASTSSDATVVGGLTDEETHPNIFAHCLSYDDSPVEVSANLKRCRQHLYLVLTKSCFASELCGVWLVIDF